MKLMRFVAQKGNFGDDLNDWIWDSLIPGWQKWDESITLFGVGTLINERSISLYSHARVLVLGTGVGYGKFHSYSAPGGWDVRSVRGRYSARALELPDDVGMVDPAMLVADFPEFSLPKKSGAVLFIPHHASVDRHNWHEVTKKLGVEYVNPRNDAKIVISKIASADKVIAESMHAAIIAEAFRVPWLPVQVGPTFNQDKWNDFFDLVDLFPPIHGFFPHLDRLGKKISFPKLRRYQRKIRAFSERFFVELGLERALQLTPFLGSGDELERRKTRYREMLSSVVASYK